MQRNCYAAVSMKSTFFNKPKHIKGKLPQRVFSAQQLCWRITYTRYIAKLGQQNGLAEVYNRLSGLQPPPSRGTKLCELKPSNTFQVYLSLDLQTGEMEPLNKVFAREDLGHIRFQIVSSNFVNVVFFKLSNDTTEMISRGRVES